MAQIPVGNPSQRVIAQPKQDNYAPSGAFDTGARELGQVGAALGEVASAAFSNLREQNALAKHQADLAKLQARASAGAAMADHSNRVSELTQTMSEDIASGRADWKTATERFRADSEKIEVPRIDDLAGPDATNYQKGISNNLAGGSRKIGRAAFGGQVAQTKGIVDATFDAFGKMAGRPDTDVDQVVGRLDSMDEVGRVAYGDGWEKKKQTAKDTMYADATVQRFNATSDSLEGLAKLKEDLINGPTAQRLDSNKRNELISKVQIRQGQLQAKLDHDTGARDATAERAAKEAQDQAASGKPFAEAQLASISERVKGTQYEANLVGYVKEVADTQALLLKPPLEQQAEIQRQETWLSQKGGDLELQARVGRMKNAVAKNVESMTKEPLVWAQDRTGTPAKAIDFNKMTDPAAVAQMGQEMTRRLGTITSLQRQYGREVAMAPLLPQEADMLTAFVSKSPDNMKLGLFGALAKSMPADAFAGVMTQLKLDGPNTAAGFAEARNLKTADGARVGQMLLAGVAIMKDKSAVFPKIKGDPNIADGEDALLPFFNTNIGDAMPAGTKGRDEQFQIFRAAYMGIGQEQGKLNGMIDTDLAKKAFDVATGGTIVWPPKTLGMFGDGKKVLKPYGMSDTDFADKADAALRTVAPTSKFAYDDLRKARMQSTNVEGEYRLLMGNGFIPGADGKPLTVKVR